MEARGGLGSPPQAAPKLMTFHTAHPQVHALHLVMAVVIFFSYLRATVHTKVKMDERMKRGFKGAPPSSPVCWPKARVWSFRSSTPKKLNAHPTTVTAG